MSASVTFHEIAEIELIEAATYYELQVKGLGEIFISEVERFVKSIQRNPELFPCVLKVVRSGILRRFPYCVMYSIVNGSVRILAIAHQKRRPFYWRGRK